MANLPKAAELIGSTTTQQQFKTKLKQLVENVDRSYSTLAEANADIANIGVGAKVEVLNNVDGGLWEKKTVGATSLTKSPYDPIAQAKADATTKANAAEANAISYVDTNLHDYLYRVTQDFGYTNITTVGEPDFIKKLYLDGDWLEGEVFVLQDYLSGSNYELSFRTAARSRVAYLKIVESDRTGVKTYDLLPLSATDIYTGKIQIDWSKRSTGTIAISDGLNKNRYVKNAAKTDFSISQDRVDEDYQNVRIDNLEDSFSGLSRYSKQVTQDYGYYNKTTPAESDFIKKLYLDGAWVEGDLFVDQDWLTAATNTYELGITNSSARRLAYLNIVEPDRTGVKTYDLLPIGSTRIYTGKIQIDWSKRSTGTIAISDGVSKNRYVKDFAKIDFSASLDDIHELNQDSRLSSLEKKITPLALPYKRYLSPTISSENFNISGGWGFSNGFAVTSTASETDKIYTKQKYISNKIQHKWTVSLRNDSIVKFGGFTGSTGIESTFVVDCVGKKLIINKKGDNASNPADPRASVVIPFNIVDNRDYFITIFRNNRKNSIKLTDAVTGESVTVEDDWSLAPYNSGSGNVRSLLYVTLASGTSLTVKKYENFLPSGVDVVFGGDSNTESSTDYSGVYQTNWADNLLTEVFGEYGAKFAEYGTVFTSWWTSIGEVIAMKPKFFIVNIGTNSATTQQQYQQIADICATNGIELILCHNPRTDGSKLHVPQNNLNMDAVPDVQIVKFDVATSINYDLEQAYNSALFTDGVHLNIAGYRVLSNRVLADVPTLKSF